MKKLSLIPKLTLAAALVAGALAIPAPARAVGSTVYCPDVYSPVICSNGQVYSNSCYASAAGATGCVPYGDAS